MSNTPNLPLSEDTTKKIPQTNSLLYNLILPTILFMSLGFFGWAVRGTQGYGSVPGSTFAAVGWAIAWYLVARDPILPGKKMYKPYGSGWAIFGMILGIGIGGMHAWMQYKTWRKGLFPITNNADAIPVDPIIGYIWWIICAAPWAGLGAVCMAWAASRKRYSMKDWIFRIALGIIGLVVALGIWTLFPQLILPNYSTGLYNDLSSCHGCEEAMGDTMNALAFFGVFMGFLLFEIIKKEWRNVKFIGIISSVTALWWVLFQAINIEAFAWRYWEGMSGAGIGFAYGLGLYFCNRPEEMPNRVTNPHQNAEISIGVYLALIIAVGLSLYHMISALVTLYTGYEPVVLWEAAIPIVCIGLSCWFVYIIRLRKKPYFPTDPRDCTAGYPVIFWICYAILRICGFLVTITEPNTKNPWLPSTFTIIYSVLTGLDLIILILLTKHKPK